MSEGGLQIDISRVSRNDLFEKYSH